MNVAHLRNAGVHGPQPTGRIERHAAVVTCGNRVPLVRGSSLGATL
jgi:hypothetical protein